MGCKTKVYRQKLQEPWFGYLSAQKVGQMAAMAKEEEAHLDISNQHCEQKQSTSDDKNAKNHLKCVVSGRQCIAKRAAEHIQVCKIISSGQAWEGFEFAKRMPRLCNNVD